ncbi:MAG: DUF2203 domain-containing protein [Candidatus Omnitrophica bacterium]|nr:DUF2203 domain-containing protein [Candidatus Omnitrophota bacterium]
MIPKVFTPKEANQTLPLVKKIVSDILKTGKSIRAISMEREKPEEDPEIIRLMDFLDDLFDELESLGCSYKDWNFSEGLVDFPCVLNGKEVFLCWRSDEPEVGYYHGLEEGFAGRRPIPLSSRT